jgi:FHA domain
MTDMKITGCVPLPGPGVAARYGDLVAVTAAPGPDLVLDAVESVAADTGDGAALVLAAARAMLADPGQPSCACAGTTADGEVAVLVHGAAVVAVGVNGEPEVEVTADGSALPVSRTFAGTTITLRLTAGGTASPDPRLRLDGGVVYAGGLAVTASAVLAPPAPRFTAEHDLPPGQGGQDGHDEPAGLATQGRAPVLHQPDPAVEFEWVSLSPPSAAPGPPDHDHDHGHEHATDAAPVPGPEVAAGPDHYVPAPAPVEGVLCARDHFNDPDVQYCRQCGISMIQLTRSVQLGQRPPLGVLLLDDGTGFTLDMDYVLGREPVLDGDVAAGRARPLRITDPDGTVSRLHLRISLIGWRVEIRDLGSANGSVLYLPAGERRIAPHESAVIEPGVRIGIGRRSVQYLSYRAG